MIGLLKIIFRLLPWLGLVGILSWMVISDKWSLKDDKEEKTVSNTTILQRMEQLGKIELVKYNFQEVTEVTKLADYVDFKLFKMKLLPDAKALLVTQGSATGCIDLAELGKDDINIAGDTLFIYLPAPEICNYKVDLNNSRIHNLEMSGLSKNDQKAFMEEIYASAETEIQNSALRLGLLEQTEINAKLFLEPLFESIGGRPTVLTFRPYTDSDSTKILPKD